VAPEPAVQPTKATGRSRLSGIGKLLIEVFVAIAMTLACFSGFLALLSVAFPPGDDMRTLMAGVRWAGLRSVEEIVGGGPARSIESSSSRSRS